MKARKVVITARGGIENIALMEYEVPQPGDKEVLIQVNYAGLGYADLILRKSSLPGLPKPPFTPGADVVGTIVKKGSNVMDFHEGDVVTALLMESFGGQAQYLCVNEDKLIPVPKDIPKEKALCLLINYLTAFDLLQRFLSQNPKPYPKPYPRVWIHGGSGGVGSALIQLAKAKGMQVFSSASTKNLPFLQAMGVEAIDYSKTDFLNFVKNNGLEKMDAVFDPIGGDYLGKSLAILKTKGVYIAYGFQKGLSKGMLGIINTMLRFLFRKLFSGTKKLILAQLNEITMEQQKERLQQLFEQYRQGSIDPVISEIFSLSQAKEAQDKLEKGERKGKIVIKP